MVKQGQLIIFLHASDLANPSWATESSVHHGDLEGLANAVKGKEVIVIVPAIDVLLTSVTMPKMNKNRLKQALPFALEEQLVSDIEELHFAHGDYQANGTLPIAVVNKEKMRALCQLLASWGVQPDIITSMSLAMPVQANTWQVIVESISTVRSGHYQGFAIENNNLGTFLSAALKESDTPPERICFYNVTNHAYAPSFSTMVMVEENFLTEEQWFSSLMKLLDTSHVINLLQGEFANKKITLPKLQVKWKVAACLAAASVALLILYPTVSYLILKYRLWSVERQIHAIYKNHFSTSVATASIAKARLQEKLEGVMGEVGKNRLLFLISHVAKGMTQTSNVKLKRFDFHHDQLTLEIIAATSENVALLSDHLMQQGLTVKQQSVDVIGSRLHVTLVIE